MAHLDSGVPVGRSRAFFLVFLMFASTALVPYANAADGDGDGIDDAQDDCEFAAGNSTIDFTGCPDSDGDGNPNFIGAFIDNWADSERELYHSGGDSRAVTWAPDGRHIAGAGGGDVNLYWVGGHITTLTSISENVRALKFSPNGSYLAVGGYEEDSWSPTRGWMLILEMNWVNNSATILRNLSSLHPGDVPSVDWSSDGSFLYTGGENQIRKFSANDNWSMVMNYSYNNGNVWALDISPDDRLVAGISGGGEMKTYWAANGTEYMQFYNHSTSYALSLSFSPDGRWLLTGGNDNYMHVYNVSNKSWVRSIDGGSDIYGISFESNGAYFVIARGGSSSTRIFQTGTWNQVYSFGSFGSNNNNRGLRAVEWSEDGSAIAFAQRRGRITTYLLPSAYLQVRGDWAANELDERWASNWANDGRIVRQFNASIENATRDICSGDGTLAALTQGYSPLWADKDSNFSENGVLDCKANSQSLIEVPIGRISGAFAVKAGGETQVCMEATGGLSIAQIRWLTSGRSGSQLQTGGNYPGLDLQSVAPNDDGDQIKEWSDLHSSCQHEEVIFLHRWENYSEPMMLLEKFLCAKCTIKDSFYPVTSSRSRIAEEWSSDITNGLNGTWGDDLLGFAEMEYMLDNSQGIYIVPIIDDWTYGAKDARTSGLTEKLPSSLNSSTGDWPIQSDLRLLVNSDDLEDKRSFVEWLLTQPGQMQMEDAGYNSLAVLPLVKSWARIGVNMTHLLPDADSDGVWDGEDACAETTLGSVVDENGCAENQLDNDGDGLTNDLDDCDDTAGYATVAPFIGCPDSDGDGYADVDDSFTTDATQWRDTDSDGFGDNTSQGATTPDDCLDIPGNSTADRNGCIDTDGDGYSDPDANHSAHPSGVADAFPTDKSQWEDTDSDGHGDNYAWSGDSDDRTNETGDAFPLEPTQWRDHDGDGFGDNTSGFSPDTCPDVYGSSTVNGVLGCLDSDGDGWANSLDALPTNPTQWFDADGDGYGDNISGFEGDFCPETLAEEIAEVNYEGCGPSERDSDGDGVVDSADLCPDTPPVETTQVDSDGCSASQRDEDGDGVTENHDFDDNDETQHTDSDSDGFGDNASGTNGDDCPTRPGTSTNDRLGCTDDDGDGWSSPDALWTIEEAADEFVYEMTQWRDSDSDGYGDNWGDASWNDTRNSTWPGTFVPGAVKPDRCPTDAYPFADSAGCPPSDNQGLGEGSGTGVSGDSGGVDTVLVIVTLVGVLIVAGLFGAIFILMKKPKKGGKRKGGSAKKWEGEETTASTEESSPELDEHTDSEGPETSENWVDTWESLPPGGEYQPVDENGVTWYSAGDGSNWYQNEDESWSLWQG